MAWNLSAELIETCSCNLLCPCWFGVRDLMIMDQGWCASALLYRIGEGNSDGVDLSGCSVVLATDFPGPTLLDANGTARLYLDEASSNDQRRELEAIFQGSKGGPMQVIAALITTWLPSRSAKIDIQDDGDTIRANVGGVGRVTSQLLRDDAGRVMTLQNAGFASGLEFENLTFQLAPSGTQWSDPEMPRSFETRSGAVARVRWSVS